MSDPMTATEEAKAMLEGVTPGPWAWEVNRRFKKVELSGGRQTKAGGDLTVMSFTRWGLQGASPVFYSWSGNYAEKVEAAHLLAVPENGREHHAEWFARIDHPDARFIAWCREGVPALIAENEALKARAEVAEAEVTRLESDILDHILEGSVWSEPSGSRTTDEWRRGVFDARRDIARAVRQVFTTLKGDTP